MVIFWLKVSHQLNTGSNPPCSAVVMHSVGSEHSPPVEGNSLIWDVVVATSLCKDVDTTESDFMLFCQPVSHFSISFSCKWTLARSILYPWWITQTLFLPGGGWAGQVGRSKDLRCDCLKVCCSYSKPCTFFSNADASILCWLYVV